MILRRPMHLVVRECTEEFDVRQCSRNCPLFHGIQRRDDPDFNSDGDTTQEAAEMFHVLHTAYLAGVLDVPVAFSVN